MKRKRTRGSTSWPPRRRRRRVPASRGNCVGERQRTTELCSAKLLLQRRVSAAREMWLIFMEKSNQNQFSRVSVSLFFLHTQLRGYADQFPRRQKRKQLSLRTRCSTMCVCVHCVLEQGRRHKNPVQLRNSHIALQSN